MSDDVLYEDGRVKVTYLHSPEPGREDEVVSGEDHELWLKNRNGEWGRYIIQRRILRELSERARRVEDLFDFTSRLDLVNPFILRHLEREGINLGNVRQALLGAYRKEDKNFRKFVADRR